MDPKEICERIDLAPEIQSEVLGADLRIPDELAARMISTDTADEAYGEIEKLCDPEKARLRHACMYAYNRLS